MLSLSRNIARGIGEGNLLASLARRERTMRDGENHTEVALINQVALTSLSEVLTQVAKVGSFPTFIPSVSGITHTLLSLSISSLVSILHAYKSPYYPRSGRAIALVYNNFSSAIQLSSLVAHLALLYLGSYATAIPAITMIALGYLERNRFWISAYYPPAKAPLDTMTELLLSNKAVIVEACSLLSTAWVIRITAISSICIRIINTFSTYNLKGGAPYEDRKLTDKTAILEKAKPESEISLNRAHVNYTFSLPEASSIDYIQAFNNFYQKVNWDSDEIKEELETTLVANKKYLTFLQEHNLIPESMDHKDRKEYIFSVFNSALNKIKTKSIESGAIDYPLTERYLRNVAKALAAKANPADMKTAILKLSCEAFEFCGDAVQRVSYELYEAHCTQTDTTSSLTQERLFAFLQELRFRRFTAICYQIFSSVSFLIDPTDTHTVNEFMHAFGSHCGLPSITDASALEARSTSLASLIQHITGHLLVEPSFWRLYTTQEIIDCVRGACIEGVLLNNGELSQMLYHFFEDDDILVGTLGESPLFNTKEEPTEYAIRALLLSHGILC